MKLTAVQLGLALVFLNSRYRERFLQWLATESRVSKGLWLYKIPLKDGSDRWIRATTTGEML